MEQQKILQDTHYKKLTLEYQKGDMHALGELIGALWDFIAKTPYLFFSPDAAVHERYVVAVLDKLPRILRHYQERPVLFLSWLCGILRNTYLDTALREQECMEMLLENPDYMAASDASCTAGMGELRTALDEALGSLTARERLVYRFRHPFLLREEDYAALGIFRKLSGREYLAISRTIDKCLLKYQARERSLQRRLQSVFRKKHRLLRERDAALQCGADAECFNSSISVIEETRRELLEEYRHFMPILSYKELASLLKLSQGTVATILFRARKRLLRRLGQEPECGRPAV